jgi:hypothetical protein
MALSYKSLLLTLMSVFVFSQYKLFAQVEKETKTESSSEIFTAKHAIYAELAGNSYGYALNYGRIFYQKDRLKISASAGFSLRYRRASEPIRPAYLVPVFPAEITAFWGKSKGHLEFGIGFLTYRERRYIFDKDFPRNIREQPYWGKTLVPRIGYRYQKPAGGFFFRAGYTPTFGFERYEGAEKKIIFNPYGIGISLGLSF